MAVHALGVAPSTSSYDCRYAKPLNRLHARAHRSMSAMLPWKGSSCMHGAADRWPVCAGALTLRRTRQASSSSAKSASARCLLSVSCQQQRGPPNSWSPHQAPGPYSERAPGGPWGATHAGCPTERARMHAPAGVHVLRRKHAAFCITHTGMMRPLRSPADAPAPCMQRKWPMQSPHTAQPPGPGSGHRGAAATHRHARRPRKAAVCLSPLLQRQHRKHACLPPRAHRLFRVAELTSKWLHGQQAAAPLFSWRAHEGPVYCLVRVEAGGAAARPACCRGCPRGARAGGCRGNAARLQAASIVKHPSYYVCMHAT